jgi:hypothetical protein
MGMSSEKGILSDLPGSAFLKEDFELHSLGVRYYIISGRAALKNRGSEGLALLHLGPLPLFQRLEDEF